MLFVEIVVICFLNKHQQYKAHRMVVVCYCVTSTVVIRLLSVGLEKEAGQGRTYSQDVGSSPTKELNWACGKGG